MSGEIQLQYDLETSQKELSGATLVDHQMKREILCPTTIHQHIIQYDLQDKIRPTSRRTGKEIPITFKWKTPFLQTLLVVVDGDAALNK